MKLIKSISEMKDYASAVKRRKKTVALVPTMGALHTGHISLLAFADMACDVSVMSIFVNPTQFGPAEDFDKYPRNLESDCAKAESAGCDCLFAPSAEEMYPKGYGTYVEVGPIGEVLCGATRPGHFRGVATVVLKLFNIVTPDAAIFGAKDAQQVAVIRKLVEDFNLPVRIITAPIVRDPNGLAMSSRNAYLTRPEKQQAVNISKALFEAKDIFEKGERSTEIIKDHIVSTISASELIKIEYAEIVDPISLTPLTSIDNTALIAVACRMLESKTRLIDNIVVG